jgi:hypothetical protein
MKKKANLSKIKKVDDFKSKKMESIFESQKVYYILLFYRGLMTAKNKNG